MKITIRCSPNNNACGSGLKCVCVVFHCLLKLRQIRYHGCIRWLNVFFGTWEQLTLFQWLNNWTVSTKLYRAGKCMLLRFGLCECRSPLLLFFYWLSKSGMEHHTKGTDFLQLILAKGRQSLSAHCFEQNDCHMDFHEMFRHLWSSGDEL